MKDVISAKEAREIAGSGPGRGIFDIMDNIKVAACLGFREVEICEKIDADVAEKLKELGFEIIQGSSKEKDLIRW